jgi:glutaredoxin
VLYIKNLIVYKKKMNFKVYTKQNCPHCYKIKQVLELTGTEFDTYNLGDDFTREEFTTSHQVLT